MLYSGHKRIFGLICICVFALCLLTGCKSSAKSYNSEGLEYFEGGNYEEALTCFNEAVRLDSKKCEYYLNKCFAQIALEDYDGATDSLNNASALEPDSQYVLRAQGILFYKKGQYNEAVESFEKCISHVGTFVTELEYDVIMYEADALLACGKASEAAEKYSVLIKTQGNKEKFYYCRAKCYIAAGDLESAISDYKDYISCNKSYEAYFQTYYDLLNAGYGDNAISILKEALELSDKSVTDLRYRGMIYYTLGEYNMAITEFQKVKDEEKTAEICIYEGMAFQAIDDIENASKFYELSVQKGQNDEALFYEIAVCNVNNGFYENADYYIKRGIEIASDEYLEKLMYLQIISNEYSHNYTEARNNVQKYIDTFGSSEVLEHELAFLTARMEQVN